MASRGSPRHRPSAPRRSPHGGGREHGTLFDFARLFELGAVDVAQPDVTKVGGLTNS